MHRMKPSSYGFTLIELSVVLVIIGLLIGGIMVGKELIKASEIRQTISTLNTISTAVNAFKTKYDCLPGDCKNTLEFFSNAGGNGDGDGWIEWSAESGYAIRSLIEAKFISETITSIPYFRNDNGAFGYLYYRDLYSTFRRNGVTISWFGSGGWANSNTCGQVNTAAFPPSDAQAIDAKIDDALPMTGGFLAFDGKIDQNPDCPAQATAPQNCRDTGGANLYQNSEVIGCRTVYYLQGN